MQTMFEFLFKSNCNKKPKQRWREQQEITGMKISNESHLYWKK